MIVGAVIIIIFDFIFSIFSGGGVRGSWEGRDGRSDRVFIDGVKGVGQ